MPLPPFRLDAEKRGNMEMDETVKKKYIQILKEELIPAEGCTEPIALAFCAAKAREVLAASPDKMIVYASGNIIKNVKSVVVPNTNGKKGIETAAVYGAVAGRPEEGLEVLRELKKGEAEEAERLLAIPGYVEVRHLSSDAKLHIIVEVFSGTERALVEIKDLHTNVVRIEKNGNLLLQKIDPSNKGAGDDGHGDFMTLKGILEFAENIPLDELRPIIRRQIEYNTRIADEGLAGNYGVNVGRTMLESYGNDIRMRCIAKAAAGSDARMSGVELPVVINSGSGNQGMTGSLPVIEYARHMGISEDRLIRALLISNLIAVYQKAEIGRLSAYCGAVSAATASVVGIAWLDSASYEVMESIIKNALGNISGIVCDGAKPSCAAKIAISMQAAFMGYELAKRHRTFRGGDGIVKESADQTVEAVGRMAHNGMVQTDEEIIRIMINE